MSEEEVYDLKERLICKGWEEAVDYIEELDAEIKELNDDNIWWSNRFKAVERDNRDYKSRIDKAIEYIKSLQTQDEIKTYDILNYEKIDLLNILDKENK